MQRDSQGAEKRSKSVTSEICSAIRTRRLVGLQYGASDQDRLVEPHALGVSGVGEEMLVGWQVSGPSRSGAETGWKNFRLSDIRRLVVTGIKFSGPRPEYSSDTVQLAEVICQL